MRFFIKKTVMVLVLVGILGYPAVFFGQGGNFAEPATAYALFGAEDDLAEQLIPDKLISEENREEVEESLKKGVAACAIATALSLLISEAFTKVPVDDFSASFKDNFLDCVMYHVVNALIEDMLRSLTAWVQGGFEGNPVFVTSLSGAARNIADDQFSLYIEENFGSNTPFICSPFQLELQLQLTRLYQESRGDANRSRLSCTLTDVVSNIDNFLEGDFSAGGWDGWFALFQNPSNNPYGAYFEARGQLADRVNSAIDEQEKKLAMGGGFFSKEVQDCYSYPDAGGPPEYYDGLSTDGPPAENVICEPPRIVTPGSFIEDQINTKFKIPDQRLTMADELNELINAVIMQLVQNVLTESEEGLSGYDINSAVNATFTPPTLENPGGTTADEPPGPPGDSQCFVKTGTFLTPTEGGQEAASIKVPLPQNVSYDTMIVEVDVTNTGWIAGRDRWPHNIFAVFRSGWRDLFGYVNVYAPSRNEVMLRHGIGMQHTEKHRDFSRFTFPENTTYRYIYTYNASQRNINLVVVDQSGERVGQQMTMVPDVSKINTGDEKFELTFGFTSHSENPEERPAFGWKYSNLKVQFLSQGSSLEACSTLSVGTLNGPGPESPGGEGGGGTGGGGGGDGPGGNGPLNEDTP